MRIKPTKTFISGARSTSSKNHQEQTLELIKLMGPNALGALKSAIKDYRSLPNPLNESADGMKETAVLIWRQKYPTAAKYLDQIIQLHKGLKGTVLKKKDWIKTTLENRGFDLDSSLDRYMEFALANYDIDRGTVFATLAVTYMNRGMINLLRITTPKTNGRDVISLSRVHSDEQTEIKDHAAQSPFENIYDQEKNQKTKLEIKQLLEILNSSRLSRKEKSILIKRIFKGITFEEIGAKLGVTKSAIQQQYQKIIAKLSDLFFQESLKQINPRYNVMPENQNLDPKKWSKLSLLEKAVFWESIAIPKKKDILLARNFGVPEGSISKSRHRAKRKLGIELPKSTQSA